jgi:SAM-dependent methyltransferase
MSVSSDCKKVKKGVSVFECQKCGHIQKIVNPEYKATVKGIYNNYESYKLSDGKEHLTFTSGIPITRSISIVKNCQPYFPKLNTALDVGCGSGVTLKVLSELFPNVSLAGFDVNDSGKDNILSIDGVECFYAGDLDEITARFDLITLIHVLEHVENPLQFLFQIKQLMTNTSILLVQVPNINENPIDIMVYDHVSHFSFPTLYNLLKRVFNVVSLVPSQIDKEITICASNDLGSLLFQKSLENMEVNYSSPNLEFLRELEDSVAKCTAPCYVLSTGPAGTICGLLLGSNLLGFIDEDESRQDKLHLGCPVLSPNNKMVIGSNVLIPFKKVVRNKIKERYKLLDYLN